MEQKNINRFRRGKENVAVMVSSVILSAKGSFSSIIDRLGLENAIYLEEHCLAKHKAIENNKENAFFLSSFFKFG